MWGPHWCANHHHCQVADWVIRHNIHSLYVHRTFLVKPSNQPFFVIILFLGSEMKLDATVMRTMNRQDFRVLAAVETGMRNHELVPAPLISSLANLRHGGTAKILSSLLRDKLLSHDRSCGYDGYRLTNSGYDILALHNLKTRGFVAALGDRIGTGKESDVYVAADREGQQVVLKLHRLGRTSFRDVKKKRDYFMVNAMSKNKKRGDQYKQQPNSWLFLSRVSALKEYAFMKALHQVEYPTPTPIAHNRHIVVMSLVRGIPLYQLHANRVSAPQAESIFEQSTSLATRLASHGLVHCDLNEFNLIVDLSGIQDHSSGNNTEHYVRHSGMSVASKGALSAHGPLERHHQLQQQQQNGGERITEPPAQPKALLPNGEAKPVVTLIDFPQMVSTKHPNAQDLFERDMQCLKRFFVMKLKCLPEEGWDEVIPKWDGLVDPALTKEENNVVVENDDQHDGNASVCLASKAQLRLDEELQASGFSDQDARRDVELYYYENDPSRGLETTQEDEDEDDDDDEEEDEDEEGKDKDDQVEDAESDKAEHRDSERLELAAAKARETPGDSRIEVDTSGLEGEIRVLDLTNEEDMSVFTEQSRAMAQETARRRLKQQSQTSRRKNARKKAFRTRNSNKSFDKGKRVFNDIYF